MSSEFFTKLIAAQELGPNMDRGNGEKSCLTLYVCDRCDTEHEDEGDAEECCKPEVYEVYRCAVCRKKRGSETEDEECCPGYETGQPMQCPVCLSKAESFEEAADCCLHTHPNITAYGRQQIAQAVSRGTPWSEAVEKHVNH